MTTGVRIKSLALVSVLAGCLCARIVAHDRLRDSGGTETESSFRFNRLFEVSQPGN